MADNSPQRLASRVFDLCVGTLLAAMALYGAVKLIQAIWLPLCIGAGVVIVTATLIALIRSRYQRW